MSSPDYRPEAWAQALLAAERNNAVMALAARHHREYVAAMTPRERARYSRWKPLRIWLRSHGLPVPPFASEPPSRVPNRHSLTIPRASDGGASITIPRAPR